MPEALTVRRLSLAFSGLRAVDDLSFEVCEGSVCGLIGPNGAGKTTILNCLTRIATPDAGAVSVFGEDLLARPVHALAGLGVMRTFQNLELFSELTALDNVAMGCAAGHRAGWAAELLGLPAARRAREIAYARAEETLAALGLQAVGDRVVADLPFGTQKSVELARALVARPRLLMMDEPAAGMNTAESAALGRAIRDLARERGMTILLVEHDMGLVMSACDRIVVVVQGRRIAEGTPQEIRADRQVIEAYLGQAAA
ncbi:amino acid/amide ABC transporter ATP-binding protein 1, HAAT family [Tistlia consotensis]|uniref:Amino acid/amide ABC transporter ATP-binding protein 1, HAAT family n=1 Tax=Tistlia consotensis USBA 355 TaxID=560819 RepID=A0A1Y6BZV7_9PROT|nr:ABC transporter ATP-binding protein [Tistlia consotensis]SMF36890.1 amino acid/amide ABC transporter ATP-binding protein 1, HAAT family [Tistlia consotensis USBA 355]SNR72269.1 amino acid/amide ABC transporter ATP-binding protein 1, HAAT family [Tistlia consotensis]